MLVEEFILRGILVAALTPFNYNDTLSLNLTVIPDYAQYLEKKGVVGVLIGATSGEGQALSVPERKSLAEEWMKTIKSTKLHLMVHIGGAPLPDVLDLARHAEGLNVDSLLTLPELYFRPSNEKELATYLKLVSDAAPKTPLLYYHTPQRAPVKGLNIAEFLENYGSQIPTLVGIKYSNTDLSEVAEALEARNRNYTIILGAEKLIYPACALGAESFVSASSNLFPELPLMITEAWKSKDFEKAKKHQELFTKALNIFPKYGNQVQGIKLAMRHLSSLDFGDARIPWNRISSEKESKLVKELQKEVLDEMEFLGIKFGGTVAEGQALSLNERKALTEEWVKAAKSEKLHLMVQVGGAPLPDVLELARHAESLKVDSLLTLPELYFRPSNGKELAIYLKLVSDAAPKTPLFYYYTPRRAPVNVNIVDFWEKYANEIHTLVGIKYTFTDLAEANQLLQVKSKKIIVTFVNEELTHLACALGAESFMLPMSSLLTKLCLSIPEAWKINDLEKAHKSQELLTKAFHIFKKFGHGPNGVKLAMRHLTPFNFGDSRIPWNRFSSEDELKMMQELKMEVLEKLESLGVLNENL